MIHEEKFNFNVLCPVAGESFIYKLSLHNILPLLKTITSSVVVPNSLIGSYTSQQLCYCFKSK